MASPEIEREVEEFVYKYPVKGRSISGHRQIIKNQSHYDSLWKAVLKDMDRDKCINAFL